jgi:hypothetical protein
MVGELACLAALALGIDVGWRPLSEGGVEYLIQIEPGLLESLQPGDAIASDLPPRLAGQVRSYRITVGTEELPRELPSASEAGAETESPGAGLGETEPPGLTPFPALPGPLSSPDDGTPGLSLPPFEQPEPAGPGDVGEPGGAGVQPRPWSDPPPPNLLPEVSAKRPMQADQAVFQVSNDEPKPAVDEETDQATAPAAGGGKPWAPLFVTLLGLFASLVANVYLGWTALDFRSRYQGLVRRAFEKAAEG